VLVIANQTAESEELLRALKERAQGGQTAFRLLVPAGPSARDQAATRLATAVERMRAAGLDVEGELAHDSDPLIAVQEAWDPRSYDEIVVSTLPTGVSKWLQVDLPHRVAKLTDAPVKHVVAQRQQAAHAPA
jgi:nucleotide-binding universal stress UspA family protein